MCRVSAVPAQPPNFLVIHRPDPILSILTYLISYLENTFLNVVSRQQTPSLMSPVFLLALLTCSPALLVTGQCVIDPDSSASWPQWPAIITDQAGDFILPQGEDNNRRITLQEDTVNIEQLASVS